MRGIRILKRTLRNVLNDPLLIGQVIKVDANSEFKKVKIIKMALDSYLNMFFNKSIQMECYDPKNMGKRGDIVLLKRFDNIKKATLVRYEINEILHPVGSTVDPITGEKMNQTTLS